MAMVAILKVVFFPLTSSLAQTSRVAPVVSTSSTRRICLFLISPGLGM